MASHHQICCCGGITPCSDPSHVSLVFNAFWDDGLGEDVALNNFTMDLTRRAGIDFDSFTEEPCYEGQIFSASEDAIYLVNLNIGGDYLTVRKYMWGPSASVTLFEGDIPTSWNGSFAKVLNDRGVGNPDAEINIELVVGDIGVRGYEDGAVYRAEFKTSENAVPFNLSQSIDGIPEAPFSVIIFFVADQNAASDWNHFNDRTPSNFDKGYVFQITNNSTFLFYDVFSRQWFRYSDCPFGGTEWGPLELIGPSTTGYWEELGGDANGFNQNYEGECEGADSLTTKVTVLSNVAF